MKKILSVGVFALATLTLMPALSAEAKTPKPTTVVNHGLTYAQISALDTKFKKAAPTIERSVATAKAAHWTPAAGVTIAKRAAAWVGLPYSYAGGSTSGPGVGRCEGTDGAYDCHIWGFDCSGLAMYAYAPYGSLYHQASAQVAEVGSFHPSVNELEPGDFVFYGGPKLSAVYHVAIYYGAGQMVEAPESGAVVHLTPFRSSGIYKIVRPLSKGVAVPTPALSKVSPAGAKGGSVVTITGKNLSNVTQVHVGGVTAAAHSVSSTTLQVTLPALGAGKHLLSVWTGWGYTSTTYVMGS